MAWRACRPFRCRRARVTVCVPFDDADAAAAAAADELWLARARTHLLPDRAGRQPAWHEKTMQAPCSQPTPAAPRILVQSTPSPVEAHPPHESSASAVLTHSSVRGTRGSAQGSRTRATRENRRTATRARHDAGHLLLAVGEVVSHCVAVGPGERKPVSASRVQGSRAGSRGLTLSRG